MAHGIVRTDLLSGTDVRSDLVSVRYQPSGTKTDIDNGNVVLLNGLETGSRTVYKGATPAANSDIKDVVLIASPDNPYSDENNGVDKFYNEAGTIARGYKFVNGNIFSVTIDALSAASTPEVGNVVELQAGTKLKVVASATSGSTTVGKIEDINTVGSVTYYAIKVAAAAAASE